ncbi:MAG: hypothetical protein GY757_39260 [bacterium]|nr:hypothetical protein [bacterium]
MFREMMTGKLNKQGRILVATAILFLIATFFLPLWMVNLDAPQYPEGLRLWVYATKLTGDVNKINILNHYIGMHKITMESFPDFQWLQYFLAGMCVLSVVAAAVGRKQILVVMLILFAVIGVFFLFRLDNWLYHYGHDFDPRAAMDIDPFKPPVWGSYKFANFIIFNHFHWGALTMAFPVLLYVAGMLDFKLFKKKDGPGKK